MEEVAARKILDLSGAMEILTDRGAQFVNKRGEIRCDTYGTKSVKLP